MTLTLWYILMAALLWSVFWRVSLTDRRTRFSIRFGLFLMALAAIVGMWAPLHDGWEPDIFTILIVAAMANLQMTFASFWKDGVPGQYIKPGCAPERRSSDIGGWA